ncbi:MAG TPA: type II toxin-antitoxin system YafQ family toxin [Candidatus Babeliales bacterium]|nr:type II toxin-antitoxin system YafQ family toxin [Candidatus Babeliales bacterium]
MLIIVWQSQFKKDFKTAIKQKHNMEKLAHIISELQLNRPLPPKNKNHKLKGNYSDCWECHIEPDWLLIYQLTTEELILIRTGSHSELF